ncbi:uncharacterized protein B0H18DRAFT_1086043 [Fomitopsis serialis]|uniref:uncharacterized protein n=1 Tax=Fomitopsis serialis TaxID=139415 RepID=UPI00200854D4|nr:uncharacterized protein B0H18DRAFT_1086043 [Neoantrodia serialis]KAH9921786.1 hypothetical protein B0H18DRAFT_1086043 [Neoantrodia serialis]
MTSSSSSTQDEVIHFELHHLRDQLHAISRDLVDFGPIVSKPPVLDSSFDSANVDKEKTESTASHESVPGLRALRDAVKRDLDVLEKFLADPNSAYLPALSTNAPYLTAVWNETYYDSVHPAPRTRGSQKSPGVKIDVVAENGHRWIRVNTVKNSRMLAEFRELDSYLTDSDSESESSHSTSSGHRPSLAQTEFDNSLLRMGRALVEAAQQNSIPGTAPPKPPSVTLRLTRLDPSPSDPKEHDIRIGQTISALRDMGLEVQLGERDPNSVPKLMPKRRGPSRLEPTLKVNLDLSLLIALVSDITHAPPPHSVEEAEARFVPPPSYVAWKRERMGAPTDESAAEGSAKHSRALANQAIQERGRGLLQEMRDRLQSPAFCENVEFWTTPEARDRCLRIVLSKIGGAGEQRRVRALFASLVEPTMSGASAEEAYWQGSRYPKDYLPLLPIRVFPSDEPPQNDEPDERTSGITTLPTRSEFSRQLAHTCKAILSDGNAPPSGLPPLPVDADGVDGDGEPIPRAATTRANPRLTAHTVRSLLWGATKGWTTMTANRASVKAILRELKTRGRAAGFSITAPDGAESTVGVEKAAIWVVDPRSLAEGMRSDLLVVDAA